MGAFLEPAQAKRLDEIGLQLQLQTAPVGMLTSEQVKGKLSLTEDQLKKLAEAQATAEAVGKKLGDEARAAGNGGFAGVREKFEALRKKTSDSAMSVLTAEQKTALAALQGEPSQIEMSDLRGAGTGGRQGGGGGRGNGGRNQ